MDTNANIVNSTPDLVAAKLAEFGITDDTVLASIKAQGVKTPDQLGILKEDELIAAGLNRIQARELLASLKPAVPDKAPFSPVSFVDSGILPVVPDDGSWLRSLCAGGVLKIDESTVISAIRAALAFRFGLFDLPAKLVKAMEDHSESIDETVDPEIFFHIRDELTRHNYADIFQAIPGLNGNYITDARKKKLFDRITQFFWPAIIGFHEQLKPWYETWRAQAADPSVLYDAFSALAGSGRGVTPGFQIPDTGLLHSQAEAVNDAVNKVFAGTGVQVTAALAYEASQIKKILEESRLPKLIGADNRDQMLKQLKVAVSSTYPRLEINITKYVLAVLKIKDLSAGYDELQFFKELYMLGSSIPWNDLGGQTIAGIGGGRIPQQL